LQLLVCMRVFGAICNNTDSPVQTFRGSPRSAIEMCSGSPPQAKRSCRSLPLKSAQATTCSCLHARAMEQGKNTRTVWFSPQGIYGILFSLTIMCCVSCKGRYVPKHCHFCCLHIRLKVVPCQDAYA
jgi:hypothetical protein